MLLKGLLLIGEDVEWEHIRLAYNTVLPNEYLVVDCSAAEITSDSLREKLAGKVNSDTRIDIDAHGLRKNEVEGDADHSISLLSDKPLTRDVLRLLSEIAGGCPLQVHIWSCYGGTAAKDVNVLADGSVILCHAPEKTPIKASHIQLAIKHNLATHPGCPMAQLEADIAQNFLSYIAQDLCIGVKSSAGIKTQHFRPPLTTLLNGPSEQMLEEIHNILNEVVPTAAKVIPPVSYPDKPATNLLQFGGVIFQLAAREDGKHINCAKLLKDNRLITAEEAATLDLTDEEKYLLNPEVQVKLLSMRSCDDNRTLLLELLMSMNWDTMSEAYKAVYRSATLYMAEIVKQAGIAREYINEKNKWQRSALEYAVDNQDPELVAILIEHGADVNVGYYRLNTTCPLLFKVLDKNNLELAKLFLRHGFNMQSYGSAILLKAVNENQLEFAKLLLQHGAKPNSIGDGKHIIFHALSKDAFALASLLLDYGANINALKPYLEYFLEFGRTKAARFLVDHGIERTNSESIWLAAQENDIDTVELLLSDPVGLGCLHAQEEAEKRGHTKIIEKLSRRYT